MQYNFLRHSLWSKLWQVKCCCRRMKPLPVRNTSRFQTSLSSWSLTIKVTFSVSVGRKTSNVGWKFGPYFEENGACWKPRQRVIFKTVYMVLSKLWIYFQQAAKIVYISKLIILFITKCRSDLTHLRLYCGALRFTVNTVTLTKVEVTVGRDPDVLSISLLGGNLQ